MDSERSMQFMDYVLRYIIDNPDKLSKVSYIKQLMTNFDFVIYYYIEHFRNESAKLTRENLESALQSSSTDWVDSKSIFIKKLGGEKVTKAFLDGLTTENLTTVAEYAKVFEKGLLARYDEIMKCRVLTDQEFKMICKNTANASSILLAQEVVKDVAKLLSGEEPYAVLGKIKYERSDCLNYILDRVSGFLQTMSTDEIATYAESVQKSFAESNTSLYPAYVINMGKSIFTNPQPGFVISVIAAEKLGKTRYVVGEHVFPAIMLKKNVLYLSGEMTKDQLRAMLLCKFCYTRGYMIPEDVILRTLKTVNKIRLKIADNDDLDFFTNMPDAAKQIIIQMEYELFYSGKYGKFIIHHISEDDGESTSFATADKSKYFIIEDYFPLIRAELDAMSDEDRYAVIVRDHVNHMTSSTGKSPVEVVTRYLQEAKTLATNKHRPVTYIIINHFSTQIAEQIAKQGNVDNIKLRGHNSNEEGKSCDIQIALYERPNQARDNLLTLVVVNDRRKRVEEIYKTKEFVVTAHRGYCDFTYFGCNKSDYPTTKDEMEALITTQEGAS